MRLLRIGDDGKVSLTADLTDPVPPYAILSHTWGEDQDEVSFEDIKDIHREANKPGDEKLRFCAKQAAHDSLEYIWIDTCCIQKSNFTELSEAITSMFRWYKNAAKCYVYLADVSTDNINEMNLSPGSWEEAFQKSRWFTRGWTLQELIAPRSVEFFCSNGRRLGDRNSLQQQIHHITKIPVTALTGAPLSSFKISERFSWAEFRETKKPEDKVYSLLGIFGVHIPLLYGEGRDSAFQRLRDEIDRSLNPVQTYGPLENLPYVDEARFNSYQRQNEPVCHPQTRVEILQDIKDWVNGQDTRGVFWLSGEAGMGKTTVARTIARHFYDCGRLAASFFFVKGGGDIGHADKFVTSIAVQLANNIPLLRQHIRDATLKQSDIATCSLDDQWKQLIEQPLSKLTEESHAPSNLLVVDALDECDSNISNLLRLLKRPIWLQGVRLRVLMTSRPEYPIRDEFRPVLDTEYQIFALHNIWPSTNNHDIFIFLEDSFKCFERVRFLGYDWPGKECIETLVQYSNGLFIWAATASKFICDGKGFPARRLDIIIKNSSGTITAPEKRLNEIYATVLGNCISPDLPEDEKDDLHSMLREILGSIIVLLSPLSVCSLSSLLVIEERDITQGLEDLHSILVVPDDKSQPLRLLHPSFRDFLLDITRCTDKNFWVDGNQAHQKVAHCCLKLMSTSLRYDICQVKAPGTLVADVEKSRIEQYIPPELQYACLYWIQHLQKGGIVLKDDDEVHNFLREHLLHWLEVLGWIGKVPEVIHAVTLLESVSNVDTCPRLSEYVYDIKRFIMFSREAIEEAPLQVYYGALYFAPASSMVRQKFQNYVPTWIKRKPVIQDTWSAWYTSLEGHYSAVMAITFNSDSAQLASGSEDGMIKLWDVSTGMALHTLHGDVGTVDSLAFSTDGKTLAAASCGSTAIVQLWDTTTGTVRRVWHGPSSETHRVAFSPDCEYIAWVLRGGDVDIWNVAQGDKQVSLKDGDSEATAVALSLNGKLLVLGLANGMVTLWKIRVATGSKQLTLSAHPGEVRVVAISPDATQIASVGPSGTVKIWDALEGALQRTIVAEATYITSFAFAPERERLALPCNDKTIRIWNTATGQLQHTLAGESKLLDHIAFSPDGRQLASVSSLDESVRLWRVSGPTQPLRIESPQHVYALALSQDGMQLATVVENGVIILWNMETAEVKHTLKKHSLYCRRLVFSPNGKYLASVSLDSSIRLWDTGTGKSLRYPSKIAPNCAIAFSPDSNTLAVGFPSKTRLWDLTSRQISWRSPMPKLSTQGIYGSVALAFSPDGRLLASAIQNMIALWDLVAENSSSFCTRHTDAIESLSFSPDCRILTSGSKDGNIWLWGLKNVAISSVLVGHTAGVDSMTFSPDRMMLASVSTDTTIILWNLVTGKPLRSLQIGVHLRHLKFSDNMKFLLTDRGPIDIPTPAADTPSGESSIRNIFVHEQWISVEGRNILWLPVDIRAQFVEVNRNVVALGCGTGGMTRLEFDLDLLGQAMEGWYENQISSPPIQQ